MTKFLWIRDGVPKVVPNVMTVYQREDYDEEKDLVFRIGNQVKVSLKIEDVVTRHHV